MRPVARSIIRNAVSRAITDPGVGGGAAPPSSFYWNPADKSPDVDLSDSDKLATNPDAGSFSSVRSVTSHNAGKWYGELVYAAGPLWGGFGGLAASSFNLSGFYLGETTDSWGLQTDDGGLSKLFHNTSNIGSVATISGNYSRWAVDFDAGKAWVGNSSAWIGGGDPTAGTSPSFTFAPGTTLFLASSLYFSGSGAQMRARTGDSDFVGTKPTGFGAWG